MNIYFDEYSDEHIAHLPSLTLAHVGDAVYELMARVHALGGSSVRVGDVDRFKQQLVRAESQARASEAICPLLTEQEMGVFRRARNSKPGNVPHHAGPCEYSRATALEALFGYLYLTRSEERLLTLWKTVLEALEKQP